MAAKRQQIIKKQELLRQEKAKLIIEAKPETMIPGAYGIPGTRMEQNEL